MPNLLHEFLTTCTRAIERERLLHLTAVRELKLYAAIHDGKLMITDPELDIEGFDFVISSEFESVHLQSKSTLNVGGARSWKIRAALLKPSFYNRDLMPKMDGQSVGGYSTGATGGVVLHIIDEEAAEHGSLEINYRYLDVYWLIGVASGMAGRSLDDRKRALSILRQLRESDDKEKIKLKLNDFAKLKSVTDIAFLRLHIGGMSNWASACHSGEDLNLLTEVDDQPLAAMWPGHRL